MLISLLFSWEKNSYCTGLSTQISYCFATCTGYVISNSFFPLKLQEIIRVNVLYTHKQFWSKGYLQRIIWSRSSRRFFLRRMLKKIHAKARLTENLVDNLTGRRVYRYNKHQLSVQNPFIRVIFHILKN